MYTTEFARFGRNSNEDFHCEMLVVSVILSDFTVIGTFRSKQQTKKLICAVNFYPVQGLRGGFCNLPQLTFATLAIITPVGL